jgi:hypothetical protein
MNRRKTYTEIDFIFVDFVKCMAGEKQSKRRYNGLVLKCRVSKSNYLIEKEKKIEQYNKK